jgi:hypothetical protein
MQIYDMNLDKVPDTEDVNAPNEQITIESHHEEERENIPPPEPPNPPPKPLISDTVLAKRKPPQELQPVSNKRTSTSRITPQHRDETRSQLLELLNKLEAPDNMPDLLVRASRRLEQEVYDKALTDRGEDRNVLGRSSTLVTALKKKNLLAIYERETDKLMCKVEDYVRLASSENAALEQVQQGDIWDVIREILDENT